MKSLFTICIIIFGGISMTIAQTSSTTNVLSTAGDYIKSENGTTLSWTIGESFSQTIKGRQHLTEGFQQGNMLKQPSLILDFTAERTNTSTVTLDWETKGNLSADGFIIQRRLDNEETFSTIAYVASEENGENVTYQLEDENEHFGKSHYRVQYMFNTSKQWSDVREVEGIDIIEQINAYPNPVTSYINVEIKAAFQANIQSLSFNIFDITGKQVVPNLTYDYNNDVIRIDAVEALNAGNYFIQPIVNGQTYKSMQFVKISK